MNPFNYKLVNNGSTGLIGLSEWLNLIFLLWNSLNKGSLWTIPIYLIVGGDTFLYSKDGKYESV